MKAMSLIRNIKFIPPRIAILLLMLLPVGFLNNSCVKNNPAPSWLEIGKWTVQDNPNAQYPLGDLELNNFTDAWVYVNDKLIGVFELPVKIPLLVSGNAKIAIYPAIKDNGISATKRMYPFTDPYIVYMDLVQNETLSIDPVTQYAASVKAYYEDFEDTVSDIENDPSQNNTLIIANDPAISNTGRYGWVHFDSDHSTWSGYTNAQLNLPFSSEIYLEIDYRNTNPLLQGLIAISPTEVKNNPNIQLNKQTPGEDVWKKIYINLREIVSASASGSYFEISFQAALEDSGLSESDIYIDNIRVVHF